MLLAASPLLEGVGGRYFEDCNEARVVDRRGAPGSGGVAAYALDPANAERLWEVSLTDDRITMPEGDTVFHTAAKLREALAGKDTDALRRPGAAVRHRRPDRRGGRRGGQPRQAPVHPGRIGASIHSHLKMDGSWWVTSTGRPSRAGHRIRIILEAGDVQAAGIDLGRAGSPRARRRRWMSSPTWVPICSATTGIRTSRRPISRADPDRPLSETLLDQRVMAGVGNVYCQRAVLRARAPADSAGRRRSRTRCGWRSGPVTCCG